MKFDFPCHKMIVPHPSVPGMKRHWEFWCKDGMRWRLEPCDCEGPKYLYIPGISPYEPKIYLKISQLEFVGSRLILIKEQDEIFAHLFSDQYVPTLCN